VGVQISHVPLEYEYAYQIRTLPTSDVPNVVQGNLFWAEFDQDVFVNYTRCSSKINTNIVPCCNATQNPNTDNCFTVMEAGDTCIDNTMGKLNFNIPQQQPFQGETDTGFEFVVVNSNNCSGIFLDIRQITGMLYVTVNIIYPTFQTVSEENLNYPLTYCCSDFSYLNSPILVFQVIVENALFPDPAKEIPQNLLNYNFSMEFFSDPSKLPLSGFHSSVPLSFWLNEEQIISSKSCEGDVQPDANSATITYLYCWRFFPANDDPLFYFYYSGASIGLETPYNENVIVWQTIAVDYDINALDSPISNFTWYITGVYTGNGEVFLNHLTDFEFYLKNNLAGTGLL